MALIVKTREIEVERFVLGPWETNAYIITYPATNESVLIDTPAEPEKLLRGLRDTEPKYVIITHNHNDHLGAFRSLRKKINARVCAHQLDVLPTPPDIFLKQGSKLKLGDLNLEILHTPGHTPGSICVKINGYLFSGDSIFPGGPGHTDSPEELKTIVKSLKDRVFTLNDNTQVFPGHGQSTVLNKEKEQFALFISRQHSPTLCGDVAWLLN